VSASLQTEIAELVAARACEQAIIAFCDLMDAGAVAEAVALHHPDAVMFDAVGDARIEGTEAIQARLERVRFSYPNRRTLHVPSNIRLAMTDEGSMAGGYIVALYDLVEVKGGRGIGARSTELLGFAHEDVVFSPDAEGRWLYATRRVRFLAGAKRLPIGVLPSGLPFEESD